jgi:hypothetical protein
MADKMAPKADVESTVNPVNVLSEDDDPFLVRRACSLMGLMSLVLLGGSCAGWGPDALAARDGWWWC